MLLRSVICVMLILPAGALAGTIHVPKDYATIQEAIDHAVGGDTVLVGPGTYHENIDFKGKAILVTSSDGPEVTVIHGNKTWSAVVFESGEGPDSILEGFTVTKGAGTYHQGGGIHCQYSSPTIRGNLIKENESLNGGGIFCIYDAAALIIDNIIVDNKSKWGGGIGCYNDSNATIRGNTISGNSADSGSGAECVWHSNSLVTDNVFSDNTALKGGGFHAGTASVTVERNVFTGNSAIGGGGIDSDGQNTSTTITNNVIHGNEATWQYGGGIQCIHDTASHVAGNLVFDNKARHAGGGIYIESDQSDLVNNLVFGNETFGGGGGVFCNVGFDAKVRITNNTIVDNQAHGEGGGLGCCASGEVVVKNTILWNNEAPPLAGPEIAVGFEGWMKTLLTIDFSDVKGGESKIFVGRHCTLDWGSGMISEDPHFADPEARDYHLLYTSRCRDAGDNGAPGLPQFDYEGDPRIAHDTVDMGADEFYPHLYFTGTASPGEEIALKVIGPPGERVLHFVGSGLLDPPVKTKYGDWYLALPVIGIDMGPLPGAGFCSLEARILHDFAAPADIPLQALLGSGLTNPLVIHVDQ